MTTEDLRKNVSDLGQDRKSMSKTDIESWLIENVVPSEAASAVEIPSMPSFVGKLTPDLQLQYYLKKELAKIELDPEEREKFREEEDRDKAREAELDMIKIDLVARLELKRL